MNRPWGIRRAFRARPLESSRAVDLEIRHHIDECVDFLVEQGMSREMALREALRRFGNVAPVRRTCEDITQDVERDMKRAEFFSWFVQDFLYALRSIRKNPTFAAALVLTLGLGIGANTAIFTVLDAVLLRPLPYERPEELVELMPFNEARPDVIPFASPAMAGAWGREADFLDGLALYRGQSVIRSDGAQPVSVNSQRVTVGLASTLGVAPTIGRWFADEDVVPGATPVVILGHHKWREWYGEDVGALGRSVVLSDVAHVVIGVMPAGFRFPRVFNSDVYLPHYDDNRAFGREIQQVNVIGRLSRGVQLADADERAKRMAEGLGVMDPRYARTPSIRVGRHDERRGSGARQALWTLMVAAVLMWLIAVGNGVNLLSVRASARGREMALRLSLGASRARLLRQLLTESLTLSLLGGLVAMLLAKVSMVAIFGLMPRSLVGGSMHEIVIGERVVWFAFALSMITGLVVGLFPAVRLLRRGVFTSVSGMDLYYASKRITTGTRALVVAQIGLSMALLVGAGLVVNSFNRLIRVEPGFETENLLYMALDLPRGEYQTREAREDFFTRVRARLGSVPGVRDVTLADALPLRAGYGSNLELSAEGETDPGSEQPLQLAGLSVEGNFFDVMGIPLLRGRTFNATDTPGTQTVIIDVDLALFLWGDDSPVGKRLRMRSGMDWLTVVGVVGDVKLLGQDDRNGKFETYSPLAVARWGGSGAYRELAIRIGSNAENVIPAVRAAVRELDPGLPIGLETADQVLAGSVNGPRFLVTLLTIAASIALVLVGIGVYGVLSFVVSQRTRELGIRIALGATTPNVRSMVLRDGMILAVIGVGLGLTGALASSRVIEALLFNVEPTDPLTLVSVSAMMFVTAGLACYLPARRATKVDPTVVLQAE